MNGLDKIKLIGAQVDTVQQRRLMLVKTDVEMVARVNKVLFGENSKSHSERLADSLESLRDAD